MIEIINGTMRIRKTDKNEIYVISLKKFQTRI